MVSTGQILYFGGDEFSRVQQDTTNNVDQTCLYDSVMAVVSAPPPASSIKAAAAMNPLKREKHQVFSPTPCIR